MSRTPFLSVHKGLNLYVLFWGEKKSSFEVVGKEFACSAEDTGDEGLIPELGRSAGDGNGNPLQYSCLENPMDRGAWRAVVHGVAKNWTQLKQLSSSCSLFTAHVLSSAS